MDMMSEDYDDDDDDQISAVSDILDDGAESDEVSKTSDSTTN